MKREYRLPDVILMSKDVTDLLELLSRDNCVFVDFDGINVSFKDDLPDDAETDKRAEYRNIVQLWHPATEKPHCIGSLLCWRLGGTFFVHEHYDHNEQNWRMFISEYEVQRYCYIGNLEPTRSFD